MVTPKKIKPNVRVVQQCNYKVMWKIKQLEVASECSKMLRRPERYAV